MAYIQSWFILFWGAGSGSLNLQLYNHIHTKLRKKYNDLVSRNSGMHPFEIIPSASRAGNTDMLEAAATTPYYYYY